MDKIIDKIYNEKDLSTNIAVFIGALSFLLVYMNYDRDPYLAFVALLSIFSLTKVVSNILISKVKSKTSNALRLNSYSDVEKSVISVYVENGTCFLDIKDLEKGVIAINSVGLDSLIARRLIEFIDGSFGLGPTGFQLDEEVYTFFLKENVLETLPK